MISYQTAYLKTHFKEPFIASVLSSDMDNTDKVVRFVKECEKMNIILKSPNINESKYAFSVTEENQITYGLGAIKGVGFSIIENIISERDQSGFFKNLDDFMKRCGTSKINKRVIEALIKSGAFDCFGETRKSLMDSYPDSIKMADQNSKNIQQGQTDIFGFQDETIKAENSNNHKEWSSLKKLTFERDVLGFYLSGHPINEYKSELKNLISNDINNIKRKFKSNSKNKTTYRIAGVINSIRIRTTSTNDKIAQINLGDDQDNIDVIINNSIVEKNVNRDEIIVLDGYLKFDEYTNRISFRAKSINTIENARRLFATGMKISVINEQDLPNLINTFDDLFSKESTAGNCLIRIDYNKSGITKSMVLGENYKISPTNAIIAELRNLRCVKNLELLYSTS